MARDNSPKIRQRAQLARKQNRRASYDRILIVSEGSKTEPLYFKEIRAAHRLHTANVEVQSSELGTEPIQVVQYARKLFLNGDPFKRVRKLAFEHVYAVFDRDNHGTYFDALNLAVSLDGKLRNDNKQSVAFKAVASIPSFEFWLLLHFEDIRHLLHRDEVVQRLKRHIPNYEKGGGGCFEATCENLEVASNRARQLIERNSAFNDTEPYTDIVNLVVLLSSLGQ